MAVVVRFSEGGVDSCSVFIFEDPGRIFFSDDATLVVRMGTFSCKEKMKIHTHALSHTHMLSHTHTCTHTLSILSVGEGEVRMGVPYLWESLVFTSSSQTIS